MMRGQLKPGDPRLFRVVGMIRARLPEVTAAEALDYLRDNRALAASPDEEAPAGLPPGFAHKVPSSSDFLGKGFGQLYENIVQLKMPSADGKERATDAADTEAMS